MAVLWVPTAGGRTPSAAGWSQLFVSGCFSPTENGNYTTLGMIRDADCRAREPSCQEKHLPRRQAMQVMSHGSVWTMQTNRLHRPYRGQTARHVSHPAMEGALLEAGDELYQKSWTKREREMKKENILSRGCWWSWTEATGQA